MEGKNVIDLKDVKALVHDYIAAAIKDGSAWAYISGTRQETIHRLRDRPTSARCNQIRTLISSIQASTWNSVL
jgi:hypothetical protein